MLTLLQERHHCTFKGYDFSPFFPQLPLSLRIRTFSLTSWSCQTYIVWLSSLSKHFSCSSLCPVCQTSSHRLPFSILLANILQKNFTQVFQHSFLYMWICFLGTFFIPIVWVSYLWGLFFSFLSCYVNIERQGFWLENSSPNLLIIQTLFYLWCYWINIL